jgi:glycosyltransferase involved in cell wall biosynthesis
MEACDGFIGSTPALCRHAADLTGLPVERFANGVGGLVSQASDAELARPRAAGPVRVGYLSGTNTHDHDWLLVQPAVVRLLERHPDVELWLGGLVNPGPELADLGPRVRRLPMVEWWRLPAVLRDLDVNLAPLVPSRFNEAKSAIKWLEAALTATPTIASPTEPFREAIRSGENGLLAHTDDDWDRHLELLVTDADARHRLGTRARHHALVEWSPHLQGRRYLALLDRMRARPATARPTTWAPVTRDEPDERGPITLTPYRLPEPATAVQLRLRRFTLRGRGLRARARRVLERVPGARQRG